MHLIIIPDHVSVLGDNIYRRLFFLSALTVLRLVRDSFFSFWSLPEPEFREMVKNVRTKKSFRKFFFRNFFLQIFFPKKIFFLKFFFSRKKIFFRFFSNFFFDFFLILSFFSPTFCGPRLTLSDPF